MHLRRGHKPLPSRNPRSSIVGASLLAISDPKPPASRLPCLPPDSPSALSCPSFHPPPMFKKISPHRSFFYLALLGTIFGTIAIVVRSGIFARSNPGRPINSTMRAALAANPPSSAPTTPSSLPSNTAPPKKLPSGLRDIQRARHRTPVRGRTALVTSYRRLWIRPQSERPATTKSLPRRGASIVDGGRPPHRHS